MQASSSPTQQLPARLHQTGEKLGETSLWSVFWKGVVTRSCGPWLGKTRGVQSWVWTQKKELRPTAGSWRKISVTRPHAAAEQKATTVIKMQYLEEGGSGSGWAQAPWRLVWPRGDFSWGFPEGSRSGFGAELVHIAFSLLIQHPQPCQSCGLSSHLHPKAIGGIVWQASTRDVGRYPRPTLLLKDYVYSEMI